MAMMIFWSLVHGWIAQSFGPQLTFAIGAVALGGGLVATSYANSLAVVLTLGLLVAFGIGVCIISVSVLQPWFDARRGIATGLAMAGSGVGNFVFAIAIERWIEGADGDGCNNQLAGNNTPAAWTAALAGAGVARLHGAAGGADEGGAVSSSGSGTEAYYNYNATAGIVNSSLPVPCEGWRAAMRIEGAVVSGLMLLAALLTFDMVDADAPREGGEGGGGGSAGGAVGSANAASKSAVTEPGSTTESFGFELGLMHGGGGGGGSSKPERRLSCATRFVKNGGEVPLWAVVQTPCNRGLMAYFFFGAFGYGNLFVYVGCAATSLCM